MPFGLWLLYMNTERSQSESSGEPDCTLQLRGVAKRYRSRSGYTQTALQSLSIAVSNGEFLAIVGPSGCGKTTLLRMCAGLEHPSAGEVIYRGRVGPPKPGEYGMVFQHPALLAWRTVIDNILMAGTLLGLQREDARKRARELLELVGLDQARDKFPGELSGGMQQRVAIARALLPDPPLLLMDEPFGALDALTREQLNIALQDIHGRDRKSILFVTHNIDEAIFLSDRIAVLASRPGYLIGTVEVPLARPRSLASLATPAAQACAAQIRTWLQGDVPFHQEGSK